MKLYHVFSALAFAVLASACCNKPVEKADGSAILLKDYRPESVFVLEEHHPQAAKFSTIDMHSHAYRKDIEGVKEWDRILTEKNVEKVIVYTYAWGEDFDKLYDMYTSVSDKFELWCGFDMSRWDQPDFPECAIKELERCYAKGAKGVGELSDKGMGERKSRVVREPGLHFNDEKFDALFEKAGELGMPINIHNGDPIWMYLPLDEKNDGYMNAEEWAIDLTTPGILDLDQVIACFEECVSKHPNTTFIGCHFINYSHDYAHLSEIMERHPNLWLDNSARHCETAATPRATKAFYEKYQDRIVFGTDNDPNPHMYETQFRVLETEDEHFYDDRAYHWPLQGIGLSDEILKKIYHDNAVKILEARNK